MLLIYLVMIGLVALFLWPSVERPVLRRLRKLRRRYRRTPLESGSRVSK